jgi:hypothetical protein
LRLRPACLREVSWVLQVSFSVLGDWSQAFDDEMRALKAPENRGKASKITIDLVRTIVGAAEDRIKGLGKRLRIGKFTKELRQKYGIDLSKKKVGEVLIANNLYAPETRRKRPRFYMSLRKEIPNGLLSYDGSQMTVWIGKEAHTFNVALSVDVKTFDHTAFSVGDSENSEELIKVLESHRRSWGAPVGVLFDHRSSNLSEEVTSYLKAHDIEIVPAGPYNAKGNGTDEGAFSHMKRALGVIRLDPSSPRELARAVLEKVVSLYIKMRNRIPARGRSLSPSEEMGCPVTQEQRELERRKLQEHKRLKIPKEEQEKLDLLHSMIRYHCIEVEPDALKHAEKAIKGYSVKAINAAEEAFLRAASRNAEKKNLRYFFGTLINIQKRMDDESYQDYCRQRYSLAVMAQLQEVNKQQEGHSIEGIVGILKSAVKASVRFVKEAAIRKARQWTQELMTSYSYPGAFKNRFSKILEGLSDTTLREKNHIWELIEQFLNPKTAGQSVTQIS